MISNTLNLNIHEFILKKTAALEKENQDNSAQAHCFLTSILIYSF